MCPPASSAGTSGFGPADARARARGYRRKSEQVTQVRSRQRRRRRCSALYLLRLAPGLRTPPLPPGQAPARSTPRRVWVGAGSGPRLSEVQKPTQETEEEGRYPTRGPEACGAGRVVERIVTFPLKRDWTVSSSSKGRGLSGGSKGWGLRVKDTLDLGQKRQQVLSFKILGEKESLPNHRGWGNLFYLQEKSLSMFCVCLVGAQCCGNFQMLRSHGRVGRGALTVLGAETSLGSWLSRCV